MIMTLKDGPLDGMSYHCSEADNVFMRSCDNKIVTYRRVGDSAVFEYKPEEDEPL